MKYLWIGIGVLALVGGGFYYSNTHKTSTIEQGNVAPFPVANQAVSPLVNIPNPNQNENPNPIPTTTDPVLTNPNQTSNLPFDITKVYKTSSKTNLMYANDGIAMHSFDLYTPLDGKISRPFIVFMHGGGFITGDKKETKVWAQAMATHGFAVATINYRLATAGAIWPEPLCDVRMATKYLVDNAATLGLDGTRFAIAGVSAGGILTAQATLSANDKTLCGFTAPVPRGGVVASGSFMKQDISLFKKGQLTMLSSMLGCTAVASPDCAKKLAVFLPETYADKNDPPLLLLHGEQDTTVPTQHARDFYPFLQTKGIDVTLKLAPDLAHSGLFDRFNTETIQFFVDVLNK
jgi:acetyl esterase/lipase